MTDRVKPVRSVSYVLERSYEGRPWKASIIYQPFTDRGEALTRLHRLRKATRELGGEVSSARYRVVEVTSLWIVTKREIGIESDQADG